MLTICLDKGLWPSSEKDYTPLTSMFSPKHLGLPLLAVIIVLSNSFFIILIATHRRLRNVPGMFLISIATADLVSGFPIIPLHIAAEISSLAHEPSSFCLLAMSLSAFQLLVIILSLFAHIVERYLFLAHPLFHKKWATRRMATATIAFVWIYSLLFGSLPLFGWNAYDPTHEMTPLQNLTPNETKDHSHSYNTIDSLAYIFHNNHDDNNTTGYIFVHNSSMTNLTGVPQLPVQLVNDSNPPKIAYNQEHFHACSQEQQQIATLPACRFDVVHSGSYLGTLFYMHFIPVWCIAPAFYIHILYKAHKALKRRTPSLRSANAGGFVFSGGRKFSLSFLSSTQDLPNEKCGQQSSLSSTCTSEPDSSKCTPTIQESPRTIQRPRLHSFSGAINPLCSTIPTSGGVHHNLHGSRSTTCTSTATQTHGASARSKLFSRRMSDIGQAALPRLSITDPPHPLLHHTGRRFSMGNLAGRLSICIETIPQTPVRAHSRLHLKPFFLLFLVLMCFVLSWVPMVIWYSVLFEGFTKEYVTDLDFVRNPLPLGLHSAGVIFGVANTAMNPIFFAFGNAQMRRVIIRIFGFHKLKKKAYCLSKFG